MVATNDDRRADFTAPNEFVHGDAELRALAIAEPANPRGQTLKLNSLLREFHPAGQNFVFWKQFERQPIGARNICGGPAERDPAERSLSFAKERTDVLRDKPGNIERIFAAGFFCLRPNV